MKFKEELADIVIEELVKKSLIVRLSWFIKMCDDKQLIEEND